MVRIGDAGEVDIGFMARTYGVSLRSLRFYEERGLLRPRRHGVARMYSPADRARLEVVLQGKRMGFTLSAIGELVASRDSPDGRIAAIEERLDPAEARRQLEVLEARRAGLDNAIAEMRAILARMEAPALAAA